MLIDRLQTWTISNAIAAHNMGLAVIYHNGTIIVEWEEEDI